MQSTAARAVSSGSLEGDASGNMLVLKSLCRDFASMN